MQVITTSYWMRIYFDHQLWSLFSNIYLKPLNTQLVQVLFFPINISLIFFVFVLTSVPNVGERFTKTWAQLHTSAKSFGEKWQIHQFFW